MDNVNKEKLDYRTEVVIGDALQVGSIYIVYISTYRNRKFNVSCIFFLLLLPCRTLQGTIIDIGAGNGRSSRVLSAGDLSLRLGAAPGPGRAY
jgi:hypothetical protein